jgi:hypothetical protein
MALVDGAGDDAAGAGRQPAGWRIIAAAWATVLLLALVLAVFYALATAHAPSARQEALRGAVIPRHETACPTPPQTIAPELGVCDSASGAADPGMLEPDY